MNRIDRVSATLIHLQSKKYVTAEEVSNRFNISRRTVYRDIRALEEAGVPIGAEPGRGYYLVDGYRLPPVMFTPEEASSLLTAGKIAEKMSDESVNAHYESAMFKIKAVLPEKEKQLLDHLNNNIEIFHSPPAHAADAPNNFILTIQKALVEKRLLRMNYRAGYNKELINDRFIEPVGLCFYSMAWHVIGYCRFRNDYRDFRVDRITGLELCNELYKVREIKSVREFFQRNLTEFNLEEFTIRFPKTESTLVQTSRYYYGYIGMEDSEDYVDLNFVSNDMEYFCRWLLMYADVVEIIRNDKLKAKFMNYISIIKNRY